MKQIKAIFMSALFSIGLMLNANAQISTPAASPSGKIEQKVGLTDIKIDYSRPSAKGRNVFGNDGIVNYGNFWRTGANSATKISFSDDVTVEGQMVKKGDYALLTKPGAASWVVNLYKYDQGNWSSYIDRAPDASLTVAPKMNGMAVETFTIDINNIESTKAVLNLIWDKVIVPVKIAVEVDKTVMSNIEKVMAGPSTNDYYAAASYYHDSNKDLEQALEWIKKANVGDSPRFWQVRREALILADLGRYKDAIAAATLSKDLAMKADNQEYVKMNEKSIMDWSKK